MREREEAGLVGRGRQIHAAPEHGVKQRGEAPRLALAERYCGARRAVLVQRQPEQRPDTHQVHRVGRARQHRLEQPLELGTAGLEPLPAGLALEQLQRREPRRHGDRIPRERARLVGIAVRGEARHDAPLAAESPDRHAAADHLAEGREIGADAEELGGAAPRQTEPRDHLVEDEERAVRARRAPQSLEELAPLRQQPVIGGHRLDDHRGDPRALGLEQRRERCLVIERQHPRAAGEGLRHAGGRRPAQGREPRARRDQQMIGVPVIAAGELHDEVAPAEGARHADRAHHRLGPRGHEAHLLGCRVGGRHALGECDLRLAGGAKGRAALERRADGADDRRMGMAGDEGAPRADQIEEGASVGIRHAGAGPARDEERRTPHGAERAYR